MFICIFGRENPRTGNFHKAQLGQRFTPLFKQSRLRELYFNVNNNVYVSTCIICCILH